MDAYYEGRDFIRAGIGLAINRGDAGIPMQEYVKSRWGSGSTSMRIAKETLHLKAAVAAGGVEPGNWGAELATAQAAGEEFLRFIRPQTILGRIPFLRHVPARVPVVSQVTGATGYYAGQGIARRPTRQAFVRTSLTASTIAAVAVYSNKLLRLMSVEAEVAIRDDLAAAAVEATDYAFISTNAANTMGEIPAGILYGAPSVASTGHVADDIEAALNLFTGSLATATWLTHPKLAVLAGLRSGNYGAASDVGARGGVLVGLPLITSEAVPFGDLILIDGSQIVVADDGAVVRSSPNASIEMNDDPTGDTITPTPASVTLVSLFQEDSTAILAERFISWLVTKPGAVVVVTGAAYANGA